MNLKTIIILSVVSLILLMGGCSVSGSYNNMVTLQEDVSTKWSQVENVYQRRSDLIPNLVNTVQGEATFEKSTLTDVIEARSKATQMKIDPTNLTPEKLQEFSQMQGQLSQALGRLMMITEAYPTLKSNEAFNNLMTQLEGTENRISVERKEFNETAKLYNTTIKKFPSSIFAKLFDFTSRPYFEMDKKAENAPVVQFK